MSRVNGRPEPEVIMNVRASHNSSSSMFLLMCSATSFWWNIVCRWIFIFQIQDGGCIPLGGVSWKASCKGYPCEGLLSACSQARRRWSYCEYITRLPTTSSILVLFFESIGMELRDMAWYWSHTTSYRFTSSRSRKRKQRKFSLKTVVIL